jgi:hypothetical protein
VPATFALFGVKKGVILETIAKSCWKRKINMGNNTKIGRFTIFTTIA